MKLIELNWIRFYATLSIVIWHCFVCPITCWGLLESSEFTRNVAFWGWVFMPIANMPLFTFLSGFLFEHIYNKSEKYKDKNYFFRNKAKRLLLPFLVFGTLISLSSPEFHLYQMLYGSGSHMWYCTMLFWGFVIAWLLKKIDNTILTLFIVIISAVVIIVIGEDVPKMPFGFHKAIFYFYYFYLGQLLCKYNSVILKYRGYIIGFCLLLVANQFWLKFNTHLGVIQYTTAFIILMYYIAIAIPSKWYREKGVVSLICSYSFGIYVFHQWISWIVYKIPYTQSLFLQDAIRFAVAFTIIDLALSLLLTNLFFKNKIGKYLLT